MSLRVTSTTTDADFDAEASDGLVVDVAVEAAADSSERIASVAEGLGTGAVVSMCKASSVRFKAESLGGSGGTVAKRDADDVDEVEEASAAAAAAAEFG